MGSLQNGKRGGKKFGDFQGKPTHAKHWSTAKDTYTPEYGPKINTADLDENDRGIVQSFTVTGAARAAVIERQEDVKKEMYERKQKYLADNISRPPKDEQPGKNQQTKTALLAEKFRKEAEEQKAINAKKTGGKYSKRKYSRIKRKRVTRKGMRKTRSKSKKNNRKKYKRR
jgi:hypothetical protein